MKKIPLSLAVLLVLILTLSGCGTPDSPYKTFTNNEGNARFSFEYSSRYKVAGIYISSGFTHLILEGASINEAGDKTTIDVAAIIPDAEHPDAQSTVEGLLAESSEYPLFILLEHAEVTVTGIPAIRLVYQLRDEDRMVRLTFADTVESEETMEAAVPVEVIRTVRFDHNGMIWYITMDSDISTAEADKADFEHVLQTFKLLN